MKQLSMCLSRRRSSVSLNPIKSFSLFIAQETVPSMLTPRHLWQIDNVCQISLYVKYSKTKPNIPYLGTEFNQVKETRTLAVFDLTSE